MALDREWIEKTDFPVGRRGYDPQAVEAHLRSVADQVEDLRRSTQHRRETLASSASEQIQSIVEAAESAAGRIQSDAEGEARQIVRDARRDAKNAREEATSQAAQYIANVSESAAGMLQRVDTMDSELGNLVETLRTAGEGLADELEVLQNTLQEVKDAVTPSRQIEFEPEEEPQIVSGGPAKTEPSSAVPAAGDLGEPDVYEEPTRAAGPSEPSTEQYEGSISLEQAEGASDDVEGARLIALNMALNGTPRDEVDRYLAENFQLSDRAALIDEVYSSVEG